MPHTIMAFDASPAYSDMSAVRALFEKQKAYFATDATKPYDWRLDQLHRLTRMLSENETRLSDASKRDFKTAVQEHVFEVLRSIESAGCTWSARIARP